MSNEYKRYGCVFLKISNKLKYEKYKDYDIDDADYDEVVLFLYKERI